jgi:hypothetical protein
MSTHGEPTPLPEHDPPFVEPVDAWEPPFVTPAEPLLAEAPEPPRPPGPHIGWALLWFLGFFGFQIAVGIGAAILLAILFILREGPDALRDAPRQMLQQPEAMTLLFLAGTIGNCLFAVVVAAVMFRSRFRRNLALRGFHPVQLAMVLLLAPPMLLAAAEVGNWAREVLPSLELNEEAYGRLAKESWVLIFLIGCILPGVGEEIFFRGFLGRGLVARHGMWLGLALSSVIFGIAHLEPAQAVATAILGLGFHLVYLSTKSILAPMLSHALNNGLAFSMMKIGEWLGHKVEGVSDDGHMPPEIALTALAAAVGLLVLFYALRTRWVLPGGEVWAPGYLTAEMPPAELDARPRLNLPPLWTVGLALVTYAAFAGVFVWKALQPG